MDPQHSKLQHQQAAETTQQSLQQKKSGQEFGNVEELLRHDARETPLPPGLAARVAESIAREPKPSRSWWKRIFTKE